MAVSASLPGSIQPITIRGYSLLLTGSAGSGKTTYALQFANEGLQGGEKAVIVTLDMSEEDILKAAKTLGYDFATHEKDLRILDYFSVRTDSLNDISIALHRAILECCREGDTRVVVDSLSTLALLRSHDSLAPWVLQQRTRLRRSPTVTLFSYNPGIHPPMLKLALQNVLDGTLELRFEEKSDGSLERYFRIFHLRGVSHPTQWHRFEILADKGIRFL